MPRGGAECSTAFGPQRADGKANRSRLGSPFAPRLAPTSTLTRSRGPPVPGWPGGSSARAPSPSLGSRPARTSSAARRGDRLAGFLEDLVHECGGATDLRDRVGRVAHEATLEHEIAIRIDRRQPRARREIHDARSVAVQATSRSAKDRVSYRAPTNTPPVKQRVVGEEARPPPRVSYPSKILTCGPPPGRRRRDDVRLPVGVDVARRDAHAAREAWPVGEEALEHGPILAAEGLHVRAAARACPGDDVGQCRRRSRRQPRRRRRPVKSGLYAKKLAEHRQSPPAEDLHVGPAAGTGPGDDVVDARRRRRRRPRPGRRP